MDEERMDSSSWSFFAVNQIWMKLIFRYLSLYGVFGEYSRKLPWNWGFMNSIYKIRAKVQEKIDERRKEGSRVTDLLSLMLSVKDEETGEV